MDPELDTAPPMIEDDPFGNVPWHAVLAPEGVDSGDGRRFTAGALRNRILPLPLRWVPTDMGGHDGAVTVGRIDRIWREANLVMAEGVFDTTAEAYEVVRRIAEGMERGVSVDVDEVTAAEGDMPADVEDTTGVMEFMDARIAGATVCPIPAFQEAYMRLGPASKPDEDEMVPGMAEEDELAVHEFEITVPRKTKDGPGWITDPKPTKRITGYWVDGEGAPLIGWGINGDYHRCEIQLGKYVTNPAWLAGLCANLHYRALGIWPGEHTLGTSGLDEAMVASAALRFVDTEEILPSAWFADPELTGPTPITITEEGRIFGHAAEWDTCHIAVGNACLSAPHSMTGYSRFMVHSQMTDAGLIATGVISLGGGHADRYAGLIPATAHYDSTSSAVADVIAGEDEFGIWISGALRSGMTAARLRELRGSSLSGDWREVVLPDGSTNLEMVAALAVNVPAFEVLRATLATEGTRQLSLVAAGMIAPEAVEAPVVEVSEEPEPVVVEPEPVIEPEPTVEPESEIEPEVDEEAAARTERAKAAIVGLRAARIKARLDKILKEN